MQSGFFIAKKINCTKMETLLQAVREQGIVQWLAFFTGVGYVALAARQNIWCWLCGGISVGLYFFVFCEIKLFSDAALQNFYLVMSVYGWWKWNEQKQSAAAKITVWSSRQMLTAIAIGFLASVPLGIFWSSMGGALPYADAVLTAFSIIATWMATQKILQNWLFWVAVDFCYILLYLNRQVELTAILSAIYLLMSLVGWRAWRKETLQN